MSHLALSSESNTWTRAHHAHLLRPQLEATTPEPGTPSRPAPTLSKPQLNRRPPSSFPRSQNVAAAAVESFLRAASLPDQLSSRALRLDDIPYSIALYLRNHVNQLAQSTLGFAKVARLHYDADAKTLVITCPTFGHEILTAFPPEALAIINANNKEFYGDWKNDCRYHIVSSGSADIPLKARNGGNSIRQPDASLRLVTADIPFLVCEMADSQSRRELKKRVQEYIVGTEGKVKIVILIKLERTRPPSKRKKDMAKDYQEEELDRADEVSNTDSGAEDEHVVAEANVPTGAAEMDSVGAHDTQADDDEEPVLPAALLPTRGNYSRGVFWVYSLEYAPDRGADHATIKCLENEQEFYPTPPTTSLVLTWASILNRAQIPADMLNRSVTIPYTILHDLFAPLTSGVAPPPGANARLKLNYDDEVLGIELSSDPSETKSEVSILDLTRVEDGSYPARAVVVPVTDRATRLSSRNAKVARIK